MEYEAYKVTAQMIEIYGPAPGYNLSPSTCLSRTNAGPYISCIRSMIWLLYFSCSSTWLKSNTSSAARICFCHSVIGGQLGWPMYSLKMANAGTNITAVGRPIHVGLDKSWAKLVGVMKQLRCRYLGFLCVDY